jgi:ParB-like chromosome segregation protein Spo0J
MVGVLDAIRHDRTLPPIEVVEAISNLYGHRLYHGRHRLAASIAVGFSLVPAVIVRDLDEITHAEAIAPSRASTWLRLWSVKHVSGDANNPQWLLAFPRML